MLEFKEVIFGIDTKPMYIKENAWIGAGATVLADVTIGKNAVVAAGSVVTKDVPDNTVVAGFPAQIEKNINIMNEKV